MVFLTLEFQLKNAKNQKKTNHFIEVYSTILFNEIKLDTKVFINMLIICRVLALYLKPFNDKKIVNLTTFAESVTLEKVFTFFSNS